MSQDGRKYETAKRRRNQCVTGLPPVDTAHVARVGQAVEGPKAAEGGMERRVVAQMPLPGEKVR